MTIRLAAAAVLLACAPAIAQTPAAAPAPDYNAGGLPRTPTYHMDEGQPVDIRAPEKKADTRQFPEQTRAPYHNDTRPTS